VPQAPPQINRPIIKCAARDRARDHPGVAQRDQIVHPADPAAGDDGDRHRPRQRLGRLDVGALHGAVAVNVGVDDRSHASVFKTAGKVGGLHCGLGGPAFGGYIPLAGVNAYGHLAGKGAGSFTDKGRVLHRHRAKDHA